MVLHCHFTFDFAVLFIDHAYKLFPRELTSFYFGKYLCITFIYFGSVRITFSAARTSCMQPSPFSPPSLRYRPDLHIHEIVFPVWNTP